MPKFNLTHLQLSGKHLSTLQALLAHYVPHAQVWAYGSRVTGGAHECSDIDLILRNPGNLTQDVPGWENLQDALQNSSLPILVEVHLWSRLPESFLCNIEHAYVVLQDAV